MIKVIIPGMILTDKGTDIIYVVVFAGVEQIDVISIDQLEYNQRQSIEYFKFSRAFIQFMIDRYCD